MRDTDAHRLVYNLLYPETCPQVETEVHSQNGLVTICSTDRYTGARRLTASCTVAEFRSSVTFWHNHGE